MRSSPVSQLAVGRETGGRARSAPLLGEVVAPSSHLTRTGATAVLVAIAPVAARLGWWWWTEGRRRHGGRDQETGPAVAATVERTEVEMVRHRLGRWRVRVVSTRWQPPTAAGFASVAPAAPRAHRPGPLWRLTTLALEGGARPASEAPRLPPTPGSAPRN